LRLVADHGIELGNASVFQLNQMHPVPVSHAGNIQYHAV
jgi:hypothetical protein